MRSGPVAALFRQTGRCPRHRQGRLHRLRMARLATAQVDGVCAWHHLALARRIDLRQGPRVQRQRDAGAFAGFQGHAAETGERRIGGVARFGHVL